MKKLIQALLNTKIGRVVLGYFLHAFIIHLEQLVIKSVHGGEGVQIIQWLNRIKQEATLIPDFVAAHDADLVHATIGHKENEEQNKEEHIGWFKKLFGSKVESE